MKLFRFNNFKSEKLINENVAQAKKLAKDTYQLNKAIVSLSDGKYKTDKEGLVILDTDGYPVEPKDMDQEIVQKAKDSVSEIEVTEEELKAAERSSAMGVIRDIVGKKQGYTYMFLYFKLVEQVPDDMLKTIMSRLKQNGDLLNRLRRNISNYIDPEVKNNSEQLVDDLDDIERYRKAKKFINEFTSVLKEDYAQAPPYLKDKLVDVASAFDELGKDDSGKIDKVAQKASQKIFFDKIKRYNTVREMLVAAEAHLKAEANSGYTKYLKSIKEVNRKFGKFGADALFVENGILVMELKSYQATKKLCGNTAWCIKDLYYWNNYVGGDTVYNRQYVIVNFNLPTSDRKSMIGVTIGPNQSIYAAHYKNDNEAKPYLKQDLKEFEDEYGLPEGSLWYYLQPMDENDIEMKKRRISANRNVVKKGISLDQLKQYVVEDGADVNAENGAPLDNAVEEDDYDKVEFLLNSEASPNLRTEFSATVNKVKSFKILKLMLNNGAELTKHAFRPMMDDRDAIKFCLENGMDPDLGKGLPIRQAIKRGDLDLIKVFIENGATWGMDDGRAQRTAFEKDQIGVAEYLVENGFNKRFDIVMDWIGMIKSMHSPDKRYELLSICQDWIDRKRVEMQQSGYRDKDSDGKTIVIDYDRLVEKYGNYMNYVISNDPSMSKFKK